MRLANIQYLFTGKGLSSFSKLDKEIYELFINERDKYNQILSEAKRMVAEKNDNQRKSSFLQKLFGKKKYWASVPASPIDNKGSINDDEEPQVESTSPETDAIVSDGSTRVLDFSGNEELAFTKPCYFRFLSNEGPVRNWTELYIATCNALIDMFPEQFKALSGKPLAGNGRVDFVIYGEQHVMAAPKQLSNGIYLESNYSATSIYEKIRLLFEYFKIETSKCSIQYRSTKSASIIASADTPKPSEADYPKHQEFIDWMLSEGAAIGTARSYSSAVKGASDFANKNDLFDGSLFEVSDGAMLSRFVSDLFANPDFIAINESQHNRFSAALSKYHSFISGGEIPNYYSTAASHAKIVVDEEEIIKVKCLLENQFKNGIRLDFSLELRKFREFYADAFGQEAHQNDDELKGIIKSAGIEFNGRIYEPEAMLGEEVKQQMFDYIRSTFAAGKMMLYYDAIFNDFEERFYSSQIFNSDMLRLYLTYFSDGSYYAQKAYVTPDNSIKVDPLDEVRRCMQQSNRIMSFSDLEECLLYIPLDKVKQILSWNGEFVWVAIGQYIHVDLVDLDENDLANIRTIINTALEREGFLAGNELIDSISKLYPEIIEKNPAIQDYLYTGLRDTIKYHLKDEYSFNGNIISAEGEELSMTDVFANYCNHHSSFSLDSLGVLASEMNTVIYFDPVYDNSLRISQNEFLSKENADFDVAGIDAAISRFCQDDYIPISAISQFALFPGNRYPWNSYLLEHYVYTYSHEYRILHAASFNATKCVGAIVRRAAAIKDFTGLIADALAKADVSLNTKNALEYLTINGFLGRRKYSGIDSAIARAKLLRSRKGQ